MCPEKLVKHYTVRVFIEQEAGRHAERGPLHRVGQARQRAERPHTPDPAGEDPSGPPQVSLKVSCL